MLETRTLVTSFKIEILDLLPLLLKLSELGWTPALLESQKVFLRLAGVLDKISPSAGTKTSRKSSSGRTQPGDVFFKEMDLYYILIPSREIPLRDELGRLIGYAEENKYGLEIGVLSSESVDLNKKLKVLTKSIEEAIKLLFDKKYTPLQWFEVLPGTPRLDRITSKEQEEAGLTFKRAKIVAEEIQAAKILSSKLARETLINILQATFARERDIIGRNTKTQDDIKKTLDTLKDAGLLDAVYLVECRKSGQALTGLKNKQQFNDIDMSNFICPACYVSLDKENLSEGYSPSNLGRQMSRQSYWMTVWITDLLIKIGIPEEAILWNITDAGEEVDLLVEFLEQLWIFELKDREFGSGDAYPLNYRQARYRASKTIIISTDKVSKDAKRVFEELTRETQPSRQRNSPIYIEGLDKAENLLNKEISNTVLRYAQKRLSLIGDLSGYDFDAIFTARYGKSFED